jgi:hypothetical protein
MYHAGRRRTPRPGLLQPATACRGGVTGRLAAWRWAGKECGAKAVDMTLRWSHSLANANTRPISLRGVYVDAPAVGVFRRFGNSAGCRHLSVPCAPPDWRLALLSFADLVPFVPSRLAALAGTGCSDPRHGLVATLVFHHSQSPVRRSFRRVCSGTPQRRDNSSCSSPPPRRYAPFWRRARPPLVDGCSRPARRSRNNAGYPIDRAGADPL